jgi:hypothetical protein
MGVFGGQDVVKWWGNVGCGLLVFGRLKTCHFFKLYFRFG